MELKDWIGKTQSVCDVVTATPYAALCATLDRPVLRPLPGMQLPELWHWLYFLPLCAQSELDPDGHAKRGDFLPPVTLPRRMWAGSQFEFHQPLCVGDALTRVSTIADVSEKTGRSGPLVFVRVRHEISRNGAPGGEPYAALTEHHDIVYRPAARAGDVVAAPQAAPPSAAWEKQWVPDDVLLFRYSALTFNGHRIHYDRRYVSEVEGYPGLVVHGPLIATLLLELLHDHLPLAQLQSFEFRALRPTFDINCFFVCGEPQPDGKTISLWARDHQGWLTMQATAVIR